MRTSILIGLLGGLAFGLLYFVPLPAFIAGLGWGPVAAGVAVAIAALLVALTGSLKAGLTHIVTFGIPVLIICYLAFLNRQKASDAAQPGGGSASSQSDREWYPVGRLVAWTLIMAGVLSLMGTLSLGTDYESYRKVVIGALDTTLLAQLERLTGQPLSTEDKAGMVAFMVASLPGMLAVSWLLVTLPSLWLGGRIVKASGLLVRPWEPVPEMQYPRLLPLVFIVALALTQFSGLVGIMAGGFASALAFGYFILGLGVLHYATRGHPMRPFILTPAYFALALFGQVGGILLTIIGVGEPVFRIRQRLDALRRRGPPST